MLVIKIQSPKKYFYDLGITIVPPIVLLFAIKFESLVWYILFFVFSAISLVRILFHVQSNIHTIVASSEGLVFKYFLLKDSKISWQNVIELKKVDVTFFRHNSDTVLVYFDGKMRNFRVRDSKFEKFKILQEAMQVYKPVTV